MLNLTTVTDQHSSQGTQLSRHSYQTKRTNPGVNVTIVVDQHPSQSSKLSRHTYQSKRTNRWEINDISRSISP